MRPVVRLSPAGGQRGIALVGALAILFFISVFSVALYVMAQDELARTRGLLESRRAEHACQSALARFLARLEREPGVPPAPLAGETNGLLFRVEAQPARGADYAHVRPGLPDALWLLTSTAGNTTGPERDSAPAGFSLKVLVDASATSPRPLVWAVAEYPGAER